MPFMWGKNKKRPVDPVITSAALVINDEGQPLAHSVTCNKTVAAVEITGGADAAKCEIIGAGIVRWLGNGVKDFEAPNDFNLDNDYIVDLRVLDTEGLYSPSVTHTFRVADVSEASVGAATLDVTVASENEVVLSPSATGATSYEYEIGGNSQWLPLDPNGVVAELEANTQYSFKARGVAGSTPGVASSAVVRTTNALPAGYNPNAVVFDGINDWINRGSGLALTGAANGKALTFYIWFKVTGGDGVLRRVFTTSNHRVSLFLDSGDHMNFRCLGTDGLTVALEMVTTTTYPAGSGWHSVLISADVATSTRTMLVDGVVPALTTNTVSDTTIHFTDPNLSIGASPNGASKVTGEGAEVFFHTTAIDLSSLVNVRKFIGPDGKARNLGADGSTPLGVQPLVYLSGVLASWHTNDGTGGGFTLNGTLAQATTGPNGVLVGGITALKADDFVEFQVWNTHVTWPTGEWVDSGWRAYVQNAHIRYQRTLPSVSLQGRQHINAMYTAAGIRAICTMNVANADGSINYAEVDSFLNNWKATSGITSPLGLDKIIGVEGVNEYNNENLFERRFTAVAATDIITTTNRGFKTWGNYNTGTEITYTDNQHGYADNEEVQVRATAGSTLPVPLVETRAYYVVQKTTTTFKLALTQNGAAIDLTTAGTGIGLYVSPWAGRFRALTSYLWNKVTSSDATYKAKYDAGQMFVIGGSLYRRDLVHYDDVAEAGGVAGFCNFQNLHLYNNARRPSIYGRQSGGDQPIIQACLDAQIMGNRPIAVTEYGNTQEFTFGTPPAGDNDACTDLVASKYGTRWLCEWWLLKETGHVWKAMYYSTLDNWTQHQQYGLVSDSVGPPYTARLVWYSYRNFNELLKEATWNGTAWTYPSFTPGQLAVDINTGGNSAIRYAKPLEKSNGRFYLLIWHDWTSWRRTPYPPEENTLIAVSSLANNELSVQAQLYNDFATAAPCTVTSSGTLPAPLAVGTTYYIIKTATTNVIKLATSEANANAGTAIDITTNGTGRHDITPRVPVTITVSAPTFTTMNVFEPTVLRGESADAKRDTPVSTNSTPNTAKVLNVPDHPVLVELIP